MIKNENKKFLTDSHSVIKRWRDYLNQLLNVHKEKVLGERKELGEIEIQNCLTTYPEHTLFGIENSIKDLKSKSLQIPAENTLFTEIYIS